MVLGLLHSPWLGGVSTGMESCLAGQQQRERKTPAWGQRETLLRGIWGTKVTISPGRAVGSQAHGAVWIHRVSRSSLPLRLMSGLCRSPCPGGSRGCGLQHCRAGGGEEQGAGSGPAGALTSVTNQKMTQMKSRSVQRWGPCPSHCSGPKHAFN